MENSMMSRAFIIGGLGILAACLPGCSILENKPAADTSAAAEQTAYYICGGCHGPENVRVDYMTPNLIGQKKGYLAAKIRDFRDGKRIHPFMNGVAEGLTDQDAINLAAYFSSYGQVKK